jgi:hypothetical protein
VAVHAPGDGADPDRASRSLLELHLGAPSRVGSGRVGWRRTRRRRDLPLNGFRTLYACRNDPSWSDRMRRSTAENDVGRNRGSRRADPSLASHGRAEPGRPGRARSILEGPSLGPRPKGRGASGLAAWVRGPDCGAHGSSAAGLDREGFVLLRLCTRSATGSSG